nr:nucleic acid-binding protein [Ligustrum necrotic ringspot virus]
MRRTGSLRWTDRTGMRNLGAWSPRSLADFKEQKLSAITGMPLMEMHEQRRLAALFTVCNYLNKDIRALCPEIINRSPGLVLGSGKSSYARRRRAKSIGRCERCYRVYPPICNSKCDNTTCVPGISPNQDVVNYIKHGVTEVIPRF